VIARAGSSGAVSEPQVHFELRRGRAAIDPVKVIGGRSPS
jgi:murein DD-endopeptidase MepM/ murein hydrolase activator NlpD